MPRAPSQAPNHMLRKFNGREILNHGGEGPNALLTGFLLSPFPLCHGHGVADFLGEQLRSEFTGPGVLRCVPAGHSHP